MVQPPYPAAVASKKPGKPGLPDDAAARVLALLRSTLEAKPYDGNKTRLAADLGMSPSAVSQLIQQHGNKPSYETAQRLAELRGVDLPQLLGGGATDRTVEAELPDALREVIARPRSEGGRRGEWSELTVRQVAQLYAYGGAELTQERAIHAGDVYQSTQTMSGVRAPVANVGASLEDEIAKRKKTRQPK
jgi:transcriptional regulator with XRE-family HTH domain